MRNAANIPLVTTVRELCRTCYTCVRECPGKAIRVYEGQAEVVGERCIGCGNCVRVCSQRAKYVYDSKNDVKRLLASGQRVAAIVAPSFPAEFGRVDYRQVVGMIRGLGFEAVSEVSFGADLVAARYRELLSTTPPDQRFIATSCPAIVAFVERYCPDLVPSLAPIVSPMVAEARVLKKLHGDDLRIVFIGPCIAKKGERVSENVPGEIDAALTFVELRALLREQSLAPEVVEASDFDPPHGGLGSLFPISRGMLQAAEVSEDLRDGQVVSAAGRADFVDAIKEFESGDLDARLLEVLACNGCINGPGISNPAPLFSRRSNVSRYVRGRSESIDWDRWRRDVENLRDLDLSRAYSSYDQRLAAPSAKELERILLRMGKQAPDDELNCGACGYDTCRDHAAAIYKGLAETEMCLPHSIEKLRHTIDQLDLSNDQLAQTREALMQSEKLAHMGQLAAGIAHELNNPLGVVLMYSHLLEEERGSDGEISDDLRMITEQADRCKKIVAGLLHFARQNKVELEPTPCAEVIERACKVCPPPEGVKLRIEDEMDGRPVSLDRDQMLQVLTNLMGNAYGAMPAGGELTLRAFEDGNRACLSVADTGMGIPASNRDKVFEPFFTTKEVGSGTGLGLAVTYGIVKMHQGDIRVDSNDDPAAGPTGTTFTISLPV